MLFVPLFLKVLCDKCAFLMKKHETIMSICFYVVASTLTALIACEITTFIIYITLQYNVENLL